MCDHVNQTLFAVGLTEAGFLNLFPAGFLSQLTLHLLPIDEHRG